MAVGEIRRLVRDRGFGFIGPQDGGNDVFFHHSALEAGQFDGLYEGQKVEFSSQQDSRGPRAVSVRPL